jgi:crotonobetainyl-CoA:carnitine CoA-transferase CaiB-like acyl-CoA transferase
MMSGLAYMTGPVGQPLRAGAPVNDMMGGMFGAIAVLAALRERDSTGKGQYVQSGLFENAAWLVSTHMMQHVVSGKEPEPMSAGKRAWGIYDIFDSADGVRIFIGVVTERQWEIFAKALGDPTAHGPRLRDQQPAIGCARQADSAGQQALEEAFHRAAGEDLRGGRASLRAHPDAVGSVRGPAPECGRR